MKDVLSPKEREALFNKRLISEYLKFGSVDEVYKVNDYDIPISYMGFQRLLDKWGIVKAAGPNTRLTEALIFLEELSLEKIPLERLYKKMPPNFKASMATMHRILSHVRQETIRRVGTALMVTPFNNPSLVLVGNDVSPIVRTDVGKPYGSITLPMGYSKRTESRITSILRVLQQEVFTLPTIEGQDTAPSVIPSHPKAFMYLDIADVRVAVFNLTLPFRLSDAKYFTSFKIENHRFMHLGEMIEKRRNFRTGIKEIALGYQKYLENRVYSSRPIFEKSILNQELAKVPEGA